MLSLSPAARAWALLAIVLLLIAAASSGYVMGVDREHDRRVAEVATLKADHATELSTAEHEARVRLQAAQARGDVLTAQLLQTESDLQRKSLETSREIKRLTTGRVCLGASTVRLLNGTDSRVAAPAGVPGAASSPAATDGSAASDTDVATWADIARRQFDTCRARLDALIDWHRPAPAGTAGGAQ